MYINYINLLTLALSFPLIEVSENPNLWTLPRSECEHKTKYKMKSIRRFTFLLCDNYSQFKQMSL